MKNFSFEEISSSYLTVSSTAIKHINFIIEQDKKLKGLRISVKKSGCAGFKYIIEKVFTVNIYDNLVYKNMNIKLYVPLKLMSFIKGTELDYIKEGLNYVFTFKNAQSKHTCGCGKSFGI